MRLVALMSAQQEKVIMGITRQSWGYKLLQGSAARTSFPGTVGPALTPFLTLLPGVSGFEQIRAGSGPTMRHDFFGSSGLSGALSCAGRPHRIAG